MVRTQAGRWSEADQRQREEMLRRMDGMDSRLLVEKQVLKRLEQERRGAVTPQTVQVRVATSVVWYLC